MAEILCKNCVILIICCIFAQIEIKRMQLCFFDKMTEMQCKTSKIKQING